MRARTPLGALVILCVAAATAVAAAAPKQVLDVRATLRGEVLPEGLVRAGDDVREGDPLVVVRTQIGQGVAARAPADGRVVEVLVRPGMVIRELGTVVARVDPK